MAKNVLIAILFIGFIGSLAFGLFKASEVNDRDRRIILAEEESKRATEARIKAEDALFDVRDSLETMTTIAMNFKIDSRKAEIRAQQIEKRHETEKANFTVHPSDSVRLRELAKHFPSILSR